MNEIMNISGIECYEKDGVAYLKLETVARGLGFTRTAASGNEVVRWETVRKYLAELGVPTSWHGDSQQVGKEGLPDFIPENVFYRLAMKAKNEVAEAFQAKIADVVIPSIRKHGAYMTPEALEKAVLNPDFLIRLAGELKQEQTRRLQAELERDSLRVQTITAGGGHHGVVTTRITRAEPGADLKHWPEIRELLNTYCGYDLGPEDVILLQIGGVWYFMADIGLRMLTPRELYRANGFPDDYKIERDYTGQTYGKSKQVARCGNAVPPPFAAALVRANLPEWCAGVEISTMEELERAVAV